MGCRLVFVHFGFDIVVSFTLKFFSIVWSNIVLVYLKNMNQMHECTSSHTQTLSQRTNDDIGNRSSFPSFAMLIVELKHRVKIVWKFLSKERKNRENDISCVRVMTHTTTQQIVKSYATEKKH